LHSEKCLGLAFFKGSRFAQKGMKHLGREKQRPGSPSFRGAWSRRKESRKAEDTDIMGPEEEGKGD